ncbi:hypothetical protein [Microbacterium sp. No. 7]|uniref:hypothetical protein n=1 Tax=Microbacterium sp. No. 7 TaxID=1714373 RepID=UPI0006D21A18|nr:hypothetical protein [Microbacterium sp. No. 7]ALJ19547.1 hypothetical protein AOA12_06340 [Microbacterium sp. No. 7]
MTSAARKAAEERYPMPHVPARNKNERQVNNLYSALRDGFRTGAEWQSARPVQITDEMVERAAKALANVPQEADWPDRWPSDDEYRDIMRDQARDALEAALGQTNEGEGGSND